MTSGFTQDLNKLTDAEKAEGYVQLFDGTLQSFRNSFVDYQQNNPNTTTLSSVWNVDAATSAIITRSNTTDARSKKKYKDFEFRFDYRNNANQGVFYRFNLDNGQAYESGIEFGIDDNTDNLKVGPGAAYDLYPPTPLSYNKFATGLWNTVRIRVVRDSVEHWMNGVKVVGFRYHSPDFWVRYNTSKWNGGNRMSLKVPGNRNGGYIEEGYIGFQCNHGGNWNMRNMRIDEDPESVPVSLVGGQKAKLANAPYSVVRQVPGQLVLNLGDAGVMEAGLLALDGKTRMAGKVEANGNIAFNGNARTGIYLLKFRTAQGNFSRKISLL